MAAVAALCLLFSGACTRGRWAGADCRDCACGAAAHRAAADLPGLEFVEALLDLMEAGGEDSFLAAALVLVRARLPAARALWLIVPGQLALSAHYPPGEANVVQRRCAAPQRRTSMSEALLHLLNEQVRAVRCAASRARMPTSAWWQNYPFEDARVLRQCLLFSQQLFECPDTADFFFTNDLKVRALRRKAAASGSQLTACVQVLLDIVIRELTNLPLEEPVRALARLPRLRMRLTRSRARCGVCTCARCRRPCRARRGSTRAGTGATTCSTCWRRSWKTQRHRRPIQRREHWRSR